MSETDPAIEEHFLAAEKISEKSYPINRENLNEEDDMGYYWIEMSLFPKRKITER
jgi:hypothetical protein